MNNEITEMTTEDETCSYISLLEPLNNQDQNTTTNKIRLHIKKIGKFIYLPIVPNSDKNINTDYEPFKFYIKNPEDELKDIEIYNVNRNHNIDLDVYSENEHNINNEEIKMEQVPFPVGKINVNTTPRKEKIFKIIKKKLLDIYPDTCLLFPEAKTPLELIKNEFIKENQGALLKKKREREKKEKNKENKRDNDKRKDNMRRKIVTSLLNTALTKRINEKLKIAGCSKISFNIFPKKLLQKVGKKNNKNILDMNLEQIYLNKDLYKKIKDENWEKYDHNSEAINKLRSLEYKKISEAIKFEKILNMNFCDMFQEYIKSEDFIFEIGRLKSNGETNVYIANYIQLAEKFIPN